MTHDSVTSYFQEDHKRLDNLIGKFQAVKACDFENARERFERFKQGLEQHMAWEENILFPLFESKTGMDYGGPTQVMRLEHEQLKTLLKNLKEEMKQELPAEGEEAALIGLLAQHNHKEENMLYPMIDQMLTQEERQEIFNKIRTSSETGSGGCCCGMGNH